MHGVTKTVATPQGPAMTRGQDMPTRRHNGGPELDDERPAPARLPCDAACLRCAHWTAPAQRDDGAFRAWQGVWAARQAPDRIVRQCAASAQRAD
jgi:hypothetical protein